MIFFFEISGNNLVIIDLNVAMFKCVKNAMMIDFRSEMFEMILDLIIVCKISWKVHVVKMFGIYFEELFTLFQIFHLLILDETYVFLVLSLTG